ncbi:hypothetical protein Tco_0426409, partial [Tanacetum coccineum]
VDHRQARGVTLNSSISNIRAFSMLGLKVIKMLLELMLLVFLVNAA